MNISNPPGSSDYWILMCSTSCETCLWLLNSLIAVACVVKVKAKLNSMIFQSLSNLTHFAADNLYIRNFFQKRLQKQTDLEHLFCFNSGVLYHHLQIQTSNISLNCRLNSQQDLLSGILQDYPETCDMKYNGWIVI